MSGANTYTVRVKPGSKKGPLVETNDDGTLTVFVREPALDGRANEAVVVLLAKHFDVAKSRVRVVRGMTGRLKVVAVQPRG